ncbi:MAG: DUF721 domain-containing protein [Bacteroidales bacterium]|nr:DUF721 domain-containing protein [Bacteroidales bacterium]
MASYRLHRKNAMPLGEALRLWIRSEHLGATLNTRRIFLAWDEASGAGAWTLKKFFREGRLYITLSSSVVRNQLEFQKDSLIEKINGILAKDILFTDDDSTVSFVKELILK